MICHLGKHPGDPYLLLLQYVNVPMDRSEHPGVNPHSHSSQAACSLTPLPLRLPCHAPLPNRLLPTPSSLMVGFCHLTDSHHYHHGQNPTMVGICHGGNMPVGLDVDFLILMLMAPSQ